MNRITQEKTANYLFPNKALTALIIPLIIEQFLSMLVGLADSIMVSSVGEAAVSGVSLVDSIMLLLFNLFSALATGGAVVTGQLLGRGREEEARESSCQLLYFITLSAVGIAVLCYLCKPLILNVLFGQIDADVKAHANIYLLIVLLSVPFMALYAADAALFRTMGNSSITMKVSTLMNVINVSGNALLVYGFKIGTAGVAIPSLVSRIVGSFLILFLLRNPKNMIYIPKKLSFRFDWSMVRRILYVGVPNGLENSMFQLGKIIVLSLVSTFGTAAIAANAVGNVVAGFQILPGSALSLAVTPIVSRCIGARDEEQTRYYVRKLLKITYLCMLVTIAAIWLGLPFILHAYHLSATATIEATKILHLHGICSLILWPIAFVLPCTFRAAGDVKFSMVVSVTSMWICRIVFSYVIGKYMHMGVYGVWIAMILDWCVRTVFFVWRYKSGKWKEFAVV